jgi:hypothetical protein
MEVVAGEEEEEKEKEKEKEEKEKEKEKEEKEKDPWPAAGRADPPARVGGGHVDSGQRQAVRAQVSPVTRHNPYTHLLR